MYQLGQWQQRTDHFTTDELSLDEELGVARMTLEVVIQESLSPLELVKNSGKIAISLGQIERLLSASQRLEEKIFGV